MLFSLFIVFFPSLLQVVVIITLTFGCDTAVPSTWIHAPDGTITAACAIADEKKAMQNASLVSRALKIHVANVALPCTVQNSVAGAKKQSITTTAPSAGTGTATGNAADAAAKPSQPSVPKAAEQQNQPKKDEPGGTSTDKKNEEKIPDDLKSKSKSGKANDDHEKSKAAEAKGNAAAPAAGDEDEGGYESCPDMTPEQLAKIANEPAPKQGCVRTNAINWFDCSFFLVDIMNISNAQKSFS